MRNTTISLRSAGVTCKFTVEMKARRILHEKTQRFLRGRWRRQEGVYINKEQRLTFVGTFTHIPYYMFSRVRRPSGGVGWVGGVGEVITFVGTFTHIPYYMFSTARRTLLCRFEPDQKRMFSDTFGSRLSTCYCHKRSAC